MVERKNKSKTLILEKINKVDKSRKNLRKERWQRYTR